MSKLSRLQHVGGGKESTQGTAVVPTFTLPWTGADVEDVIEPIRDESIRANDSVLQGQYGGAAMSNLGFDFMLYPDVFPHHLRALIGPDTVTGAGPYTHTFKSNNTQPPSYTWTHFDTVAARAFPGCMLGELGIKIDTKGSVVGSAKWVGWPSAAASTPTPSYSALQPYLGWQMTWSANAVSSSKVLSADITIKRDVDTQPGSDGTQAPRETFAGGLELECSAVIAFEDATDRDRFLTYAQNALVISLVQPAGLGGSTFAITVTKASWKKAKLNNSGKYVTLEVDISGIYNVTDAGAVSASVINAVSAAY